MTETDIIYFVHHLTLYQDFAIVGVPLVIYLIKTLIKPSKLEIEVLTRLMLPVLFLLMRKLASLHKDYPHKDEILHIKEELTNLKGKISQKAIG